MVVQEPEYLDNLFINQVNELERLGRASDNKRFRCIRMAAIIRQLFLDEVALAKTVAKRYSGEFLNRIAADYDVNPGRIAEIKKRYKCQGSYEVALRRRPH